MSLAATFTPGKKYVLDGAKLNELVTEILTNRILPSGDYDREVLAGQGTRLTGIKASAGDSSPPWDLIDGEAAGSHRVAVGTILRGNDSLSDVLTCSNPTEEWALEDRDILAIKIEDLDPTTYSIVKLPSWPEDDGYTVTYTGTIGGEDFAFVSRHYPLWQIGTSGSSGTIKDLGGGLKGRRKAPKENLQIVQRSYRTPDGEYPLLPDFEVGPEALVL